MKQGERKITDLRENEIEEEERDRMGCRVEDHLLRAVLPSSAQEGIWRRRSVGGHCKQGLFLISFLSACYSLLIIQLIENIILNDGNW